ncbi:N-formylglutamate deformylase [Microbaculum marinum]|uniref:N-formylglutamate deformylase n=1 Tax=Microbaculum marinum TaxID=1764581 RepID=A0AAW9RWX6_9HYPH
MSDFIDVREGSSPLILSIPHGGTDLAPEVAARLNETGLAVPDTDWWMARLYDFADDLDPTIVQTRLSRYVIDVNRDPSGASLYPGQATTGLCPTTTFDGEPIYRAGMEPDEAEIARRRAAYFVPYHDTLQAEIDRVRKRHGYALLYDCHSIRSVVPRLFEGTLPVFNIGTNAGKACAREIEAGVEAACAAASLSHTPQPHPEEAAPAAVSKDGQQAGADPTPLSYSHVLNGRFKGGWITRRYGRPEHGVHAVQMELAIRAYAQEAPPWTYEPGRADPTRAVLRQALENMLAAAARLYGGDR